MEKKYREVFDGVRASERLRKEVLEMKYLERKETRYALRPALAAVLAVLLLAACAAVPGAASALADYFSERWSEQNETALTQEQLDFIGAITQTVGVSDTVDGVTVTLEAVTAGESSLWMLLTMDGLDVPAEELVEEDLRFATAGLYLEPAYDGYNYGVAIERPLELRAAEDGRLMLLFRAVYDDETSGVTFLTEPQALIALQDLRAYGSDGRQKSVVAKGIWRLKFELKPLEKEAEGIVLRDVTLPAMYLNLREVIDNIDDEVKQKPCEVLAKELRLTSTEMHIYLMDDGFTLPTGEARLILDDGAEVRSSGYWWDERFSRRTATQDRKDDEVRSHYIASWDLPVDLSRAAALRVGEETIPLK